MLAIRHWSAPDHTRIVVDLSEPVGYTHRTLEDPARVAVDIADQIAEFLLDGIAHNAVNAPTIAPEALIEIAPFTLLAEKIGTVKSLMAMGRLVERLEHRQVEERKIFHRRFGRFSNRQNRRRFKALFKPVETEKA